MSSELCKNIVVIGSGTGGPNALKVIFSHLPELDAAIIIVQHMSKQLNEGMVKRINSLTKMEVKLAEDERLSSGTIYIAPSKKQLDIKDNSKISFSKCPKESFACPSIDGVMKSLDIKKDHEYVGILLSGIGHDGIEGIEHIDSIGGTTIAQKVSSAIISHMPEGAIDTGSVEFILKPEGIRAKLIELFKK